MYSDTTPTAKDDRVVLLGKLLQRANDTPIFPGVFTSASPATEPGVRDTERDLLAKMLILAGEETHPAATERDLLAQVLTNVGGSPEARDTPRDLLAKILTLANL